MVDAAIIMCCVGNENRFSSRADNINALCENMQSGLLELRGTFSPSSEYWQISSDAVNVWHFDGLPHECISFDENDGEDALSKIVYGLCTGRLYAVRGVLPDFLKTEMVEYNKLYAMLFGL